MENGADEIDMVINVGELKSGNTVYVENEIKAVRAACEGKILKVIIETCLLTNEQKVKACLAAKAAGADYVKTSTGFSTAGATVEDVALMRKTVGPDMGVKAAGGIRSSRRCHPYRCKLIQKNHRRLRHLIPFHKYKNPLHL